MDSTLRKALETQAAVDTASALKAMAPRVAAIEARLDQVIQLLAVPPAPDPRVAALDAKLDLILKALTPHPLEARLTTKAK